MEATNTCSPPKVNNNYQEIPDVPPLSDPHHFRQTQDWTAGGANDNLAVYVRDASTMTTENSGTGVSSAFAITEPTQRRICTSYMNKYI